jgi:hypothetical protein
MTSFNLFNCNTFKLVCKKKDQQVYSIIEEIDLLQDLLLEKPIIINRIFSKIQRIIGCEYFLLHNPPLNIISSNFIEQADNSFIEKYIDQPRSCTQELRFRDNLFGHIMHTKKIFITNNIYNNEFTSCRFPSGHPTIKNLLAIPFKETSGEVYAIGVFANTKKKLKMKDYYKIKPIINVLNDILPELLNLE